jgi:predicted nucleic acid-binding Zn ribbon protein
MAGLAWGARQFDIALTQKAKHLSHIEHEEVKRLIGTGAGLIFKGSGFYITDYRSEGYKQAAKKDAGGGSKETKAADKPAASSGSTSSGGTGSSASGGSSPASTGTT